MNSQGTLPPHRHTHQTRRTIAISASLVRELEISTHTHTQRKSVIYMVIEMAPDARVRGHTAHAACYLIGPEREHTRHGEHKRAHCLCLRTVGPVMFCDSLCLEDAARVRLYRHGLSKDHMLDHTAGAAMSIVMLHALLPGLG